MRPLYQWVCAYCRRPLSPALPAETDWRTLEFCHCHDPGGATAVVVRIPPYDSQPPEQAQVKK